MPRGSKGIEMQAVDGKGRVVDLPDLPPPDAGWTNTDVVRMMTRADTPAYRKAYKRGWTYSSKPTASLDTADRRGWSADNAWMDGYSDYAAGLPQYHRLRCPDHMTCDDR